MRKEQTDRISKQGIPWRKPLLFKKLCLFLFIFAAMPVLGKEYSQNQRMEISLNNVSVETLIKQIKSQLGLDFLYNIKEIERNGNVTIKMKGTVEEILREAFKEKELGFSMMNNVIVIKPQAPQEKTMTINGIVKDPEGSPIPGVTVIVKGTKVGVSTDMQGAFKIMLPQTENIILLFSFVGMKTKAVAYKGQEMLTVEMEEDNSELDEVVVTGFQVIDKRHLTSAITSVKAEDILVPGMTSIEQALEGRIPELMMMTNSGEVGVTPRIRIRGTSTMLGNQEPLWVLDGIILSDPVKVETEELNNPDYVNIIGNAIAGINPQDIERIDILKDASATALYGVRAANGVIVVTTKKGAIGKARVSYNHSSKLVRRPRYSDKNINLMNSQERVQFGKDLTDLHYVFPGGMPMVGYEGALYRLQTGRTDYAGFLEEVKYYETINTDWFDILTRDTYSHSHNIGVSGGSEDMRYYASIGYDKDNGATKTTFTERYTARVNLNATILKKVQMGFSLSGNVQNKNHLMDEINAMDYAYNTTRALPCYNKDGSLFFYDNNGYKNGQVSQLDKFQYNILNEINNSSNSYEGNSLTLNLDLKYDILPKWDVSVTGSYSTSRTLQEKWWGEKTNYISRLRNGEYGEEPNPGEAGNCELPYGGVYITSNSSNESYTLRLQSNYRKLFGIEDRNLITAAVGVDVNSSLYKSIKDENRGFIKERGLQFIDQVDLIDFPHYTNWLNQNHRELSNNITNRLGAYLTMTYSYKQHFTLNANTRFDASNKFGNRSNEKLLPVWSVSGMWNLTQNVLKDATFISEMKIRGSYGKQGNMLDGQSPNLIIKQGVVDPYYGENVSTVQTLPNPNLRWEQTTQINGGIDLSFLESRLNLTGSIYYKKTTDCFSPINVSSVNGVKQYTINNGDLSNSGYSISLYATPLKVGEFKWSLSTYYSANFNEVKSGNVEKYTYRDYLNGTALVSGEAMSTFYSYPFLGLNPVNGTPMFDDYSDRRHLMENKTLEEAAKMVMVVSGKRDPVFGGNLTNNFTYKGFSVSMNLSYSLGSKVRLFPLYEPVALGVKSDANVRKEFTNRWMVPGDEKHTNVPVIMNPSHPDYGNTYGHYSSEKGFQQFAASLWDMYDKSDMRVVSGNYLKCQSFSFRYNFEKKQLKKTPFSAANISFNATNLFTISAKELKGQDPSQAGFAKPQLSVRPNYTLAFSVSF